MKKILLSIGCLMSIVCIDRAVAQSFTTPYDTINATYTGSQLALYNNITNITAAPIQIKWNVENHNFPVSWTSPGEVLGICDNALCRNNNASNDLINGAVYTSMDYASNVAGDFHLQLDLENGVSGTHYMTIMLKDAANPQNSKRITYVINKWTTGVGSTSRADNNVMLFPNPARNTVNLNFSANSGIRTISIYNLIGKMVTSYKVNGSNGKAILDISNIPSGIYYARLQNAQGEVVATRRFTRQ